jgi:cyclophilin family peptidyl-prolyl cis-trans isomerase/HEAT repeat protein
LTCLAVAATGACTSAAALGSATEGTPSEVQLGDSDVETLASLLSAADGRRADTTLVDRALTSATPFVRTYAVRVVGQIGIAARTASLRTLVAGSDSMLAADAAFSLGLLHDSAAVPILSDALAGPPTVVAAAAWSLGELGERGRPALEQVLEHGQPRHALSDVLQATAKLRPVPASRVFPYVLDSNVVVRRSAVYALTRTRVPAATAPLIALAQRLAAIPGEPGAGRDDADVELRSYVARGLSRAVSGDSLASDARVALHRLTNDVHPHVRINAIRSLATYGPDARADLTARLRDPDANTRIALAQSLGSVLSPALLADWNGAWRVDTGFTYRKALLANALRVGARLPAIDPTSGEAWQRSGDWRHRAAAAEAAAGGSAADIDAIAVPLFHDPDGRVRNAAFNAATAWVDSTASVSKAYGRDALRSALSDSDLFVRATILDALRSRARASDAWTAFNAWRRATRDPENDARLAALRVIATAWSSDSASFGTLRDSLLSVQPPTDPLERSAGRAIGILRHWPATGVRPREHAWYVDQVRAVMAPTLSGHPTRAVIATERGRVFVLLHGSDAPLTVANFAALARRGYYNRLVFHRVVPNFVAQDGDPRGDGNGGPGYAIRDELNRRWYDRGAVGMALSGPDTGGSQYFLTHSPQPHLDGHYTVFGHVTAGFDVLDALVQGDRILSVSVE